MRAAADFPHGVHHVGERIALSGKRAALELPPAIDHFAQHDLEVRALHFGVAAGRAEHRRKAHAVESSVNELVESAAQFQVRRRYRHARRYLHAPLAGEQRPDPEHNRVKASAAALVGPQRVVHFPRAVEADGDRKAVLLEEIRILLGEQRPVGGDRERDGDAAAPGDSAARSVAA